MVKASDVLGDNENFMNATNGTVARKGSIAATLLNAAKYTDLMTHPHSADRSKEIEQIVADVTELLPALEAVGLFSFFSLEEWLNGVHSNNEGRAFVAIVYLMNYPQHLNSTLRDQLSQHKDSVGPELRSLIELTLSR